MEPGSVLEDDGADIPLLLSELQHTSKKSVACGCNTHVKMCGLWSMRGGFEQSREEEMARRVGSLRVVCWFGLRGECR